MIRQPKKKVYGAVIGAAVQVGKAMSEAGVSAIEERQQRMMEEAEASGYKDLDTNSLANKEALKNAIEWNPIKKIQSATANKDMSTSGKVASVAGSMGLGAVSGIANLFNKDLSAGEKAASFIPFVGGAMANRAAARKMKDRMVNQAEFAKQSEEGAKKME
jgi:hypothetical protein